eukprot:353893-Ditylum_brightwellii.AAC.1
MPSSSANNSKQCAANAAPQVSQKTQNLDKIPLIPPKDTPKNKKTLLRSLTSFPAIMLEEWDSSELERLQSITAG